MEKKVCVKCGGELSENEKFCAACGEPVNVAAQQEPAEVPAGSVTEQVTGPVVAAEEESAKETVANEEKTEKPAKEKKKFNLGMLIGICGGVVAAVLAVVLILVLADGPKLIKNKDNSDDIAGWYEGEVTVEKIKISGDYNDIAQFMSALGNDWNDKETQKALQGEEVDVNVYLGTYTEGQPRSLRMTFDSRIFIDPTLEFEKELYFPGIEIKKGRAKGEAETTMFLMGRDYEAGTLHLEYNLTLRESEVKNADYNIKGSVVLVAKVKLLEAETTYRIELKVDADY